MTVSLILTREEAEHLLKVKHCKCVKHISAKLAFSTTRDGVLRIEVRDV